MTSRERFLATMLGGAPDRIPFLFGGPRQSTFEAWYQQGLSRDTDFWKLVGPDEHQGLPLNLGPLPAFEPVVIEETKRHKIWIDELGAKRIDHKYLPTPGFVTRKWLEFPVKNRADFREMLRRYDPATPERLPADWEERKAKYRGRFFILSATIPSMFWRVRDWVGFENLCVMFHDDPALVHEMMEYVADFNIEVLRRALDGLDLDFLFFNEKAKGVKNGATPVVTRISLEIETTDGQFPYNSNVSAAPITRPLRRPGAESASGGDQWRSSEVPGMVTLDR